MSEEASKIKDNLLIILVVIIQVLNSVIVAVPAIPLVAKQVTSFVIPFAMIFLIVLIDYHYRVEASKYFYIEQSTRSLTGKQRKLHLFIKEPTGPYISTPVDPSDPDWCSTTVDLANPIVYGIYKNVTKITYEHDLKWGDRIASSPGKALYKGYRVDHNKCAYLTAWEKQENFHVQDHLEDHLTFVIAEAPLDIFLQSEPIHVDPTKALDPVTLTCPECQKPVQVTPITPLIAKDCVACKERTEKISYQKKHSELQQYVLRLERLVTDLKKHMKAALSRVDVLTLCIETITALMSLHSTLTGVKKELTSSLFKLTNVIIIGIIAAIGILALSAVPDFRVWASSNWLIMLALIGGFMFVSYLILKRKG